MTDPWPAFLAALADPDQPAASLAAAHALTVERVGAKLFTVTAVETAAGDVRRVYSSDPVAYPVSGRKPAAQGAWSERVITRRLPFVANTLAEIAEVFPDHALIASLGCGSALNIPIVVGGAVVATVNLLDVAGHYAAPVVEAAMALRPFYAVAVLAGAHGLLRSS